MLQGLSLLRCVGISTATLMLLAGCASNAPAPIESRTSTRPAVGPADAAPVVARPGYYIVKRGDTLYSIAHQFDRDFRELASWNGLDDPNVIKAGQELRVAPASADAATPSTGTTVVALPASSQIESTPVSSTSSATPASTAPVAVVPSATAPVGQKTEPKGGRLAYSEQAWKDLQARDKQAPQSAPVAKSESKPATQSTPVEPRSNDSKPAAAGDDDVEWIWPGSGKVLATFNDSSNKGVDIAGNAGDPVVAAGAGRIVYVGSGLRGYGNLVIIKHNNNFLSAYAHNSEILVKEGQAVQKGQKIATLGSTDTDRPKLHFEIRRQGKPVDPLKYLPSR